MKTVKAVAAIIRDGNRIFATQRGYGDFKDGWEFPGGKIEPGETPRQALKREIKEELDVDIEVEEYLTTIEYDYSAFHLSMQCFWCKVTDGTFVLKEHKAARWIDVYDLECVEWLPADQSILIMIRKEMKDKERPDTSKRDKLLSTLISRGISNESLAEIVKPMRGKTQQEKERIAEQIMKEMDIE